MNGLRTTAALASLTALLACAGCAREGSEVATRRSTTVTVPHPFSGTTGQPPAGWRTGTTNLPAGGRDARWELRDGADAPSPPTVLSLVDARGHAGSAFDLCWTPDVAVTDVDVEVAVRAEGGVEDQGGGPARRLTDEDH